jgi:hypothetical protein
MTPDTIFPNVRSFIFITHEYDSSDLKENGTISFYRRFSSVTLDPIIQKLEVGSLGVRSWNKKIRKQNERVQVPSLRGSLKNWRQSVLLTRG